MENTLMHYGILGMKWGVRRTPEQLGHVRKKKNDDRPNYHVNARKLKKEEPYMSDQDLQRALNRLNNQRQVDAANPSIIRKGMKFVSQSKDDMKTITQTAAAVTALYVLGKKYGSALESLMREIKFYDVTRIFD